MTEGPQDDDVLLTARQARKAEREAVRQAKDLAYEERLARKRSKDGQFWHGRHIIDADGLAEAFPEPETPEYAPGTVRRRITHGVTLVLLLAAVVAAVVLVGMVQRGELELKFAFSKPTVPAVTCPALTLDYPANTTVSVNVLNAGSSEGMAGAVAAELGKRGFQVLSVENGQTEQRAPAVVVSGSAGYAGAFNLQRNVVGAEYVQDDRKDASVDFIVTGEYKGLIDPEKVDQTPGVLSCPRMSPPPADPSAVPPATDGPAVPPAN